VGKRQRHTDMVALPDEEVSRRARDRRLPRTERRRYQQEEKWRGRRNVKRSS